MGDISLSQPLERFDGNEPPLLSGTLMVPARDCRYPPAVEPNDFLRVDFDKRTIGCEGLYLVEVLNDRGVEWRGCRRFARMPDLRIDLSGTGEWKEFPSLSAYKMRVAGFVEQVYKPVKW